MILWTIKLVSNFRKAIAGRRYPSQLAWAVAFGFLLGVVPHGNLLAIALLIVVLTLKLNHAAAGLTAIVTTVLAGKLDPVTHSIGNFLLNQPKVADLGVQAWALPLVPWTNLNNTVVLGSLVLGLAMLLPIFLVTFPVFRLFKPKEEEAEVVSPRQRRRRDSQVTSEDMHVRTALATSSHSDAVNHRPSDYRSADRAGAYQSTLPDEVHARVDAAHTPQPVPAPNVQTRIDVIRMSEPSTTPVAALASANTSHQNDEMDEALNYLLRQLRDSQQKDAA